MQIKISKKKWQGVMPKKHIKWEIKPIMTRAGIIFVVIISLFIIKIVFIGIKEEPTLNVPISRVIATPTPQTTTLELHEITKKELTRLQEENNKLKQELTSRGSSTRGRVQYDYTKLTCPKELVKVCEEVSLANGFTDIDLAYCIGAYECNFDPKQITNRPSKNGKKGEYSVGWCQVNLQSYTETNEKDMLDQKKNLQFMMKAEWIDKAKKAKEQGLTGVDKILYVVKYGQRPDWANDEVRNYIIRTVNKYYAELQEAKIK